MRIVAYTALHYGNPYFAAAIRSVIDHVDELLVLYSPDGSHGIKSALSLPQSESRDMLYRIAVVNAGNKLTWIDGNWTQENEQRNARYKYAPDADVFLTLDSDEIWPDSLPEILEYVTTVPDAWFYKMLMVHFWRSFRRAVINDPALPDRIEIVTPIDPTATIRRQNTWYEYKPICHMGYAIPTELMIYKWQIHGHRAEYRHDIDWLKQRWAVNAQEDCHPVGSGYWNPVAVDPLVYLPSWMAIHPYFKKEIIE